MNERQIGLLGLIAYVLCIIGLAYLAGSGCGGTPDLPPCGPETYEFQGICLPTETEPPCGPGTHNDNGECLVNDGNNHPAFCGEGTHWDNNACDGSICGMCVADLIATSNNTVAVTYPTSDDGFYKNTQAEMTIISDPTL